MLYTFNNEFGPYFDIFGYSTTEMFRLNIVLFKLYFTIQMKKKYIFICIKKSKMICKQLWWKVCLEKDVTECLHINSI